MINLLNINLKRSIVTFSLIVTVANILHAQTNTSNCLVPIPTCGKLQLKLPKDWNAQVVQEKSEEIPTFAVKVGNKNDFIVIVSPLAPCGSGDNFGDIDKMLIDESKMLLPSAVEEKAIISKLPSSKKHTIYHFSLTDKAPAPGDFKYLTRIIGLIDNALINLTILKHKKEDSREAVFLKALSETELIEKINSMEPVLKSDTLVFNGKDIFLDRDSMAIIGKKESNILTISNLKINSAIILPYTENWKLWSTPRTLLSASTGDINFSLMRIKSEESVSSYLNSIKKQLTETKERHGLVKAEVTGYNGISVLRTYSIPPSIPGVNMSDIAQFSYFSVKKDNNFLYVYHISKVIETQKDNWQGDDAFIKFAGMGLQLNIEKNLK